MVPGAAFAKWPKKSEGELSHSSAMGRGSVLFGPRISTVGGARPPRVQFEGARQALCISRTHPLNSKDAPKVETGPLHSSCALRVPDEVLASCTRGNSGRLPLSNRFPSRAFRGAHRFRFCSSGRTPSSHRARRAERGKGSSPRPFQPTHTTLLPAVFGPRRVRWP